MRSIYILPNLLTASSIFVGILSVIESSKGNFEKASIFLFIALLLDGLDGRVARMTNSTSDFGVEFDSLADIVSFGVAPAMMLYFYTGVDYGKFGAMVSALFVVFGAIRLARFNVTTKNIEPSLFIGLPIPTAAVAVTIWIMFFDSYELKDYSIFILSFTLFVAILMVSNIRYPSFKKMDFSRANILKMFVLLVVILGVIYVFPIEGFLFIINSYLLFGLFRALSNLRKLNHHTKTNQ
jgi:CDP-diacylglycerol--serine O-phosphatidyltransferase